MVTRVLLASPRGYCAGVERAVETVELALEHLAQKPVIAAKAGGAAEIIIDRVSGMLVQPGDSRALAQAIESVLGDADFSSGLAAGGYSRARKLYSLETMIKRISEEVRTTLDHINR